MIKTIITALICSVAVVVLAQTWQNHGDGRYSYSGTLSADDVIHGTICMSNTTEVLSVSETPVSLTNYVVASVLNGFSVSLAEGSLTCVHDGTYDVRFSQSILGMGALATYVAELTVDGQPTGYRFTQSVANLETASGSVAVSLPLVTGNVVSVDISQTSGSSTITTTEAVLDARQL